MNASFGAPRRRLLLAASLAQEGLVALAVLVAARHKVKLCQFAQILNALVLQLDQL